MDAYDGFTRARRTAFDRKPDGDQILCLTQHTAKLPAHYPNYEDAKTTFKALKTLRRRIAAVIASVANTAEVRTALEEANHDDVVCKRVLENKCGFDFLAIAKAKLRGRGRAPAAAGAGAPSASPAAESKSAQRRRRREEREAAAKQPQASAAAPANAAAETRGAAPTSAPARKPGHTGAPAGNAATGRKHS